MPLSEGQAPGRPGAGVATAPPLSESAWLAARASRRRGPRTVHTGRLGTFNHELEH
jgi:hypothetical protein